MADLVAISNAAADAAGIPRLLLLACACAESGLNATSRRPTSATLDATYWPDVSGGAWQQTVRWDPDYHGGAAYPGEAEIERVLALQYDPERSARVAADNLAPKWRQYQPDIFATLCAYNWPAGGGKPASAATEANYRAGLAEAQRILGGSVPKVTYNKQEPAIAQNDPWSCAPTSTRWALKALGRNPAESWMESQMKADGIVSEADGLLDASGEHLAAWIQAQYAEFGYLSNSEPSVSFDWCAAEGGHAYPVLIGGRAWGHWSVLKDYDAARDVLLLMNPAPVWMGVGDTMNRGQFGSLGPFSAVRIWHPDLIASEPPPPLPPAPPVPTPAEIRAMLVELLAPSDDAIVGAHFRKGASAILDRIPPA